LKDEIQIIPPGFKSGFIAIVGAPNVGKSTLLNRILGQKISITSKKPQTTRNRILGVLHRTECQLIFIDTPGVHLAKRPLNVQIVETAMAALGDVDLVLFMIDVSTTDAASEAQLLKQLNKTRRSAILVLNKIDKIAKYRLLDLIETWSSRYPFKALVPISAKTGEQVDTLIDALQAYLPEGPPFFPDTQITDLTERFLVAEIIREKVFRLTGAEIPYATAVTIESFTEDPTRPLITIHATIHVERASQKGIIIGKQGAKLKQIGTEARRGIEGLLNVQVFLKLFVRVDKNWSQDSRMLRRFGYL
jgi:GTP-binding protein Era